LHIPIIQRDRLNRPVSWFNALGKPSLRGWQITQAGLWLCYLAASTLQCKTPVSLHAGVGRFFAYWYHCLWYAIHRTASRNL